MLVVEDLDFAMLVRLQHRHQTRQADLGVRTQAKSINVDDSTKRPMTMRGQIIRTMHQTLKTQEDKAVGTGCERSARWTNNQRIPAPGGRDGLIAGAPVPALAGGNSANAAITASALAKQVNTSCFVLHFSFTSIFFL